MCECEACQACNEFDQNYDEKKDNFNNFEKIDSNYYADYIHKITPTCLTIQNNRAKIPTKHDEYQYQIGNRHTCGKNIIDQNDENCHQNCSKFDNFHNFDKKNEKKLFNLYSDKRFNFLPTVAPREESTGLQRRNSIIVVRDPRIDDELKIEQKIDFKNGLKNDDKNIPSQKKSKQFFTKKPSFSISSSWYRSPR